MNLAFTGQPRIRVFADAKKRSFVCGRLCVFKKKGRGQGREGQEQSHRSGREQLKGHRRETKTEKTSKGMCTRSVNLAAEEQRCRNVREEREPHLRSESGGKRMPARDQGPEQGEQPSPASPAPAPAPQGHRMALGKLICDLQAQTPLNPD